MNRALRFQSTKSRRALRALLQYGLSAVVMILVAGSTVEGQVIELRLTGAVADKVTGDPVDAAVVTLDSFVVGITGADGEFASAPLEPGVHELVVRRIGYALSKATIRVERGTESSLDVLVWLEPQGHRLTPISVVGEPADRSRWLENQGFYGRVERGSGQYLTRADIEKRNTGHVRDLFDAFQGAGLGRNYCRPTIFLDGLYLGLPDFKEKLSLSARRSDPLDMLELMVNVDDIGGIEVYRGPSEIPIRFNRVAEAGPTCPGVVVVVWTR